MSVKLIATGDFMAGENVHHFRRGIIRRFAGKYETLIAPEALSLLKQNDLLLLNLESGIAPLHEIKKMPIQRAVYVAPHEAAGLLLKMSSTPVVTIANNHFGQHGPEAAAYTIDYLEQNGIAVTGKNNQPVTILKDGLKILIYGVSLVNDRYYNGSYFKSTYESLLNDLNPGPKQAGEIRILSIHWGDEYLTLPHQKQKQLASELNEAGFDYILGHHPHVIQPAEKTGNCLTIFSHGNFVFDQNFSRLTQTGLISAIDLPEGKVLFYFSYQKHLKVGRLQACTEASVYDFCHKHYSKSAPLRMRIRMKIELLLHFYELNISILRTFTSRLFKTNKS